MIILQIRQTDCGLRFPEKPRTAGLCGRAARISDCGPLSCAFIERVNKGRKPPKRGMAGRETPIPKGSVSHCRTGFTGLFHTSLTNAATFVSRGCVGYTRHPGPEPRTQRLTRRNTGVSDGVVSLPSERFAWFGNPARPGVRTAYFAAFGPWSGVLPKSAESLRDSDAHDARRCHEAPRPRWAA